MVFVRRTAAILDPGSGFRTWTEGPYEARWDVIPSETRYPCGGNELKSVWEMRVDKAEIAKNRFKKCFLGTM